MQFCSKQDCIPEQPDGEFHTSLVFLLSWEGDTGKGNWLPGHFSLAGMEGGGRRKWGRGRFMKSTLVPDDAESER